MYQPTAPYCARYDEKYEWETGQKKHMEALRTCKGQVDQSIPRSINPSAQSAQARTRRFCEAQRNAEIGRENQKLVNKLSDIARGLAGSDPRGPPQLSKSSSAPGTLDGGLSVASMRPSLASFNTQLPVHTRSLNEPLRKKNEKQIDSDNACLVRRILAMGPLIDRKKEANDFQRHQRAVKVLQRFHDKTATVKQSQSQPVFRMPRLTSDCSLVPPRGLELFLLPDDLKRYAGKSDLLELPASAEADEF